MDHQLKGLRIAILATNGFEQLELTEPYKALLNEGATVHIISDHKKITSWHKRQWGSEYDADELIYHTDPRSYLALILPGGVINPDRLRRERINIDFVRHFQDQHKTIAAICHGPQMLIEADAVRGRRLTSFHSVKTDLINAGASWVDEEVVVDDNLITSRTPSDLPAFNQAIIDHLSLVAS